MRTVVVRQYTEDDFVDTAVGILKKTDDDALRQLTYNSVCQDLDDIDREQCPKPDFMKYAFQLYASRTYKKKIVPV